MAVRETVSDRAVRIGVLSALFLLAALITRLLLAGWTIDPDLFFHLTSGRWIVTHHAIPTTDVLSWYGQTHATRWLPHEWLFDVVFHLVWKLAGFQGVFALTSLALGVAVLCTRRLAQLRGASWLTSLAIALIALAGMVRFISPRPGAITFVLLPLIAIMLEKDRWVPALLLFVLGMNFHGGAYPIYLLVILYYASPKKLWLMAVACVLVLAQPLTFGVLKYPFFTLTPLVSYIQDFQATQLGTDFAFLGVLVGCWLLLDRERTRTKDLVAAAILIGLSLQSVRTQAYFYLLGLPLLAASFRLPRRESLPSTEEGPWSELAEEPRRPANPRRTDVAILVSLLACALLVGVRIPTSAIDVDRDYPRGALEYVTSHKISRFWNEWNDGGYLMFRGVAPFVDGRLDPFDSFFNPGTTVGLEYMRTYRREADIRPFLRKYGITTLMVHRTTGLYQVLVQSRDFRLLYQDPTAAVFEFEPAGS